MPRREKANLLNHSSKHGTVTGNGGGGIRTLVGGISPETVFETVSSETTTRPEFGSTMRISVEHYGLRQGRGNGWGNEIGVKM